MPSGFNFNGVSAHVTQFRITKPAMILNLHNKPLPLSRIATIILPFQKMQKPIKWRMYGIIFLREIQKINAFDRYA